MANTVAIYLMPPLEFEIEVTHSKKSAPSEASRFGFSVFAKGEFGRD